MKQIEELLKLVDIEWIKNNPDEALTLIQLGKKELDNRKAVIEKQREKELLLQSIIEDYKQRASRKNAGRKNIPITVFGKEYSSHKELANEFGISNKQISHWKSLGVLEQKLQLKKEGKLYTGCGKRGRGRKNI